MINLNRWVKAVLATASTTALLSMVATTASAFELRSELDLATGYRNDNARFGICSTLSDPRFFGYGLAKFRNINMWEVQLTGVGAITDNAYFRGLVGYATVLGGKYRDSGVFDILSDPFNATLGEDYYTCCAGCKCDDKCPPCSCECADKTYHRTVEAKASLSGSAWDASIALGYMFHASEEFGVAPVIGWSFNQQRYKTFNGSFGPIPLQYFPYSCRSNDPDNPFYDTHAPIFGGVAADASFAGAYGLGNSSSQGPTDLNVTSDAGLDVLFSAQGAAWLLEGKNAESQYTAGCDMPCISFGQCPNNNSYRARWNGPFIGLDFLWTPSQDWNVTLGYELHYQHLSGRFDSIGGGNCCDGVCSCESCPTFSTVNALFSFDGEGNLWDQCQRFCPASITWSSNGWGQVFSGAINYQCNQNWQAGIALRYTMANANGCDTIDPCSSCCEVLNGAALWPENIQPGGGVLAVVEEAAPVWSDASFQKARWRSFSAQVSVGYLF